MSSQDMTPPLVCPSDEQGNTDTADGRADQYMP